VAAVITLPCDRYSIRQLPLKYIVVHTTEGTDSRGWLSNSPGSQVSIHYLERDDDEYAIVPEEYAAWQAGIIVGTPTTPFYSGVWEDIYENGVLVGGGWTVNPNDESIGIEMEGFASQVVSQTILKRTVDRIKTIRAEHRDRLLPLVGHFELSPGDRTDPGQANFLLLKASLTEEDDMFTEQDRANLQRIKDLAEARENMVWDARLQRGLDVETGKPYDPAKGPVDQRIKT
jgi:N-acetyl-anhydromuramyl-L-alanine amidase AmpD